MITRLRYRLNDLPIRKKLMVMITATAAIVLVLSTAAFVTNEIIATVRSSMGDLSTTSGIIASNSSAALAFNDSTAAAEVLQALESKPGILAAVLFDARGNVFARYVRGDLPPGGESRDLDLPAASLLPDGALERGFSVRHGAHGMCFHFAKAIVVDGDRVGTLHLIRDNRDLRSTIGKFLAIAACIIVLSGCIAVIIASRAQRVVSRPIDHMIETMTKVSATNDYSIRARKFGRDELGSLVDGFNEMLRRVAEGTAALENAKTEAEAGSLAKSRFLANMSHEVRTPLNGIVGMLKLMRRTALDELQTRYVDTAITASDALLSVINDILDFSKVEAGRLELESLDFSVRDAVERVVQMFAERASQKKLELAAIVHRTVPARLRGDPNRLAQVLINLIGNAIKFTETGEVVVRAQLEERGTADVTIRFTVSDTGVGITGEQMKHLFQAFSQGDASTTRRFGGTGLGLAISEHLVKLMGGSIGVESTPERGSTFWFTVRLGRVSDSPPASEPESVSLCGLRVLVVDDSGTNREILRHQIGSWDCSVSEASNGPEALKVLRDAASAGSPFDIAIIDGHMPSMHGEELGRLIRSDAALRGVRLVLLTSMSDTDSARAADAGFAARLTKPVRETELRAALAAVLRGGAKPDGVPGAAAARPAGASRKSGRILVAEDNDINQALALEILRMAGHSCDCVGNGRAAVAAVQTGRYDLVLMDCQMPVMDGYEATRTIREWEAARTPESGARRLPIVALTAHALPGDREQCLKAGMDDYMGKPLDPGRLQALIDRWLNVPPPPARHESPAASVPAASQRDLTILDFDALVDRCMGNAPLAQRLVAKFRAQAETDLEALRDAIAREDQAQISFLAHRIKGAAATVSAEGIRSAAARMESLSRAGDARGAAQSLDSLRAEVERFRAGVPAEPSPAMA